MRAQLAVRASACLCLAGLAACGVSRWPVAGPLAAPFGVRWDGAFPDVHRGVDILVPAGTPVTVMSSGTVRFAGTMDDFGLVAWLDHGSEVLTVYAHLSELRAQTGERLGKGAILGLSGSSGNATGPHLHFEIWRRGVQIDPVAMLGGPPDATPPPAEPGSPQ